MSRPQTYRKCTTTDLCQATRRSHQAITHPKLTAATAAASTAIALVPTSTFVTVVLPADGEAEGAVVVELAAEAEEAVAAVAVNAVVVVVVVVVGESVRCMSSATKAGCCPCLGVSAMSPAALKSCDVVIPWKE